MKFKGISHIAALIFFLMPFWAGCERDHPTKVSLPLVRYMVVEEETISHICRLPGRISAMVDSDVRPQVDGIISERLFVEGSLVEKGQTLYQIEPSLYEAAYKTAKASLAEAEAAVTALELREKRYRNLIGNRAVSQQDLDNAISSHGEAKARVEKARVELETAKINLDHTRIKAPVSGRIGASAVTPGALVTANQPESLATIQQLGSVYVDMSQSSADALRLRRAIAKGVLSAGVPKVRLTLEDGLPYVLLADAQNGSLTDWLEGDLLFSEIQVSESTGTVAMRAIFDNPDGLLLPGMQVTASIVESVQEKAILVPQSCVLTNGEGKRFIFILTKKMDSEKGIQTDEYLVAKRFVILGRSIDNRWLVKKGIVAGDMVVIDGLQKVGEGQLVRGKPVKIAESAAEDK